MDHQIGQLDSSPYNDEKLEEVLRRRLVPYPGQGLPKAENLTLTETFFLYASHSILLPGEDKRKKESRHSVFPSSVLKA